MMANHSMIPEAIHKEEFELRDRCQIMVTSRPFPEHWRKLTRPTAPNIQIISGQVVYELDALQVDDSERRTNL